MTTAAHVRNFWRRVEKSPDGCWLYGGARGRGGYGATRLLGESKAHRAAYRLARGPIPAGLEIDHLCRTRACVNPSHLEAVPHAVNMQRARRDRCQRGHEFRTDNLSPAATRQGVRRCRECLNAWQRERNAERRAA